MGAVVLLHKIYPMPAKFFFAICFLLPVILAAQNNNVGINTSTPDPTAVLHLESANQGLLVPRLSSAQRDAITTPATGLIIYNTDDNQEEIYNGTCWIPSYLDNCDDCSVQIGFAHPAYGIDRVNTMMASIPVVISQTTPSGQNLPVNLALTHTFSQESRVTLSQNEIPGGTATVTISIETTVFEVGGDHFVTLFAFCGENSIAQTVKVEVQLCDQVVITADQVNYDLQANGITGDNCVVVTIADHAGIRSADADLPAFTTGAINPACNLGIINKGYVFGKGGNGPQLMGQDGQDGGTAFELNCKAEIRNTGMIYGGGGAGLTVGALQSIDLGVFTVCIAVGAGGGGGMPDGVGGGSTQGTCGTVIGIWSNGNSADSNYDEDEGAPVNETFSQSFSLGPVQGAIVITARGGGGGDFGKPGTTSSPPVDFSGTELEICTNIPFIGNVCIPVPGFSAALNGLANLINNSFNGSTPGDAGYAIKHTMPVSIPDGMYQSYSIRGRIGN